MLNAKSAEDQVSVQSPSTRRHPEKKLQRIAAIATLHHKLLDVRLSPRPPPPSQNDIPSGHDHVTSFRHSSVSASTSTFDRSPRLAKMPSRSSSDVTLPSIHVPQSPRKRPRISRSPPPLKRRCSEQDSDHQGVAPSEQLPPSPPFSSPGRTTLGPELAAPHPPPRDAMAIGSLLSSRTHEQEADSDWPSRTSSERERDGHRREAKVSG